MACASQILWLCSFLFQNILYERHDCLIISSPISLFTESSETTDWSWKSLECSGCKIRFIVSKFCKGAIDQTTNYMCFGGRGLPIFKVHRKCFWSK